MSTALVLGLIPTSHEPERAEIRADSTGSKRIAVGIASKYPRDRGIAQDANVLIHENFEDGGLEDLSKRWEEISNKEGRVAAWSADQPAGSLGKRCLQLTATPGLNTGGHLYRRLPKSVDQVYARFYVKFDKVPDPIHHFVHIGGYLPATRWPQGGAGERPKGNDRITVGIEPHGDSGRFSPPGIWSFYAYWHQMKISADGRYWGNGIRPARPATVPKDRWQCVEVMVKLNSAPGVADGELALWLDGVEDMRIKKGSLRGPWTGMGFQLNAAGEPFEGFDFRTSLDLKLNFFWLLHYVTEENLKRNKVANPQISNRVWFDDIVIATEYIGPTSH